MHAVAAIGVNSRALWYLTRGTGLVAILLLTVSLVLGVTQAVRYVRPGLPQLVLSGLHRNTSLIAVALVIVHVVTAVLDTFAPINVADAIIPFIGTYRPLWLGLGALAFDLMVVLIVTSLLRERLGLRAWRLVHWTGYACWPVALAHGLGTGTDTKVGWVTFLYVLCALAVVSAIGWRAATDWSPVNAGRRSAALVATGATAIGLVVFTVVGPLRSGWARRSGTPVALLGGARTTAAGQSAPSATLTAPFSASFAGSLTKAGPDPNGADSLTIAGPLSGQVSGQLRIVLKGTASHDGGISLSAGTVAIGPSSAPDALTGAVTSLDGSRVHATVSGSGQRMDLEIQLRLDGDRPSVTGTVEATS